MPANVLLEAALKENVNLTAISLGMLIQDVWEGMVKRQKRDHSSRFLNLKKRSNNGIHRNDVAIHELDETTIEKIRLLCCDRPGWILNSSLTTTKSVTLTRLLNPVRMQPVTVDGRHLTLELKIDMTTTPTIIISTCGKEVALSEIKGVNNTKISLRSIDEAICLLENASPCIGSAICSDDESEYLKSEVAGSYAVTVGLENLECRKRLVSSSCLLFRFRSKACNNCLYTAKLHRNRSNKRKLTSSSDYFPPEKCNLRFLDQEGLERKIKMQRQILKSDSKRESRNKIELVDETTLIDLVDEDNSDLMEIVKSTDIADVPPPNLKLLWEQQMKQLSMKSSSGYRWDPRCCVLLSILGFHVTSYVSVGVNSKSNRHGSELHVHCMCWPRVS